MTAASNLRRIGWAAVLAVVGALLFALALQVNAVKSDVRRTELKIVALKQEKLYLETEFETRSNQQQLESWNDVDFGYVAPGPGQYLENPDQLAALGRPTAPAAPVIEVAAAPTSPPGPLAAIIAPVAARPARPPELQAPPAAETTDRRRPGSAQPDVPPAVAREQEPVATSIAQAGTAPPAVVELVTAEEGGQ